MRILTFTTLFPNPAEPTLGVFIYQRMAHVIRRPGTEVRVVAPVPYVPRWLPLRRFRRMSEIPYEEQKGGLVIYHPRYLLVPKLSMPFHGLLIFLGSFRRLQQLKREMSFECIDGHYIYPDGFAAVLLGKTLHVPVILSARGTDINLFPTFRTIRPMIRWSLSRARGLIAVCGALKQAMVDLGVAPEKVSVIGNGVDLERFRPVERTEARQRLGLPEDGMILVAVGGLIPRKGYHHLIRAFAQNVKQGLKPLLYIVGEGESRAELEKLAQDCRVSDLVQLVGSRPNDELRYWFSAADVSCLTSSREGWPNVLLESMACGTPVVATGVWGTPEVVVSPQLGVIVEQTPESIANGLAVALRKKWDRVAIRRYAESRTWDDVAVEVCDYLTSCLASQDQQSTKR
jgi:teichuronic acid biosynthesis glycosyltransferase TuaC